MSSAPVLLDDAAMRRFIVDGYLVLKPQLPAGLNGHIYEKLDKIIVGRGNPENNILPWVPELRQVLDHPVVSGALASILGPDYYLHLHRHVHDNRPGSKGQSMHKDSLFNSRFAVGDKRRHHHTRWVMLFYYPQETPLELGPTAILPRSQYLNVDAPEGQQEVALTGEAGTVTLVHYDLVHRGMANSSDQIRYMAKFLFTRMSEPQSATWNHVNPAWEPMDDPQDGIWQHLWNWHRAVPDAHQRDGSIPDLAARLGGESEIIALPAAYDLGLRGPEAVAPLLDALSSSNEVAARNAAYAFNRIGSPAVPALLDAAAGGSPQTSARALDVLGDMGLFAESAVPQLSDPLRNTESDSRRWAAEALGTAGQRIPSIADWLSERLLIDENAEVRRNAALSLARLGTGAASAVPALANGLTDTNHFVRGYSAHALGRINTPAASQVLIDHLQTVRWDWEQH